MTLAELCDQEKGFLVNDACIVGVEILVSKSTDEKSNSHIAIESPELEGKNQETLSSVSKVTGAELVSAALGRVIYFLKTRKVKDMNDEACKELQVLWDDVAKYKFDLTWLEPQVHSALGMRSYVQKALQVEKLKENMVVLKRETEMLSEKLAASEGNLEIERDLLKAQGIKERDLHSELGSGSWKP